MHGSHDHSHDHDEHGHTHSHAHAAQDHSHADHEHGWAPWRYVVLLMPILLFLLGMPSKGLQATFNAKIDTTADNSAIVVEHAALVALDPWSRLAWAGKLLGEDSVAGAFPVDFTRLFASADDPVDRQWLKGKM